MSATVGSCPLHQCKNCGAMMRDESEIKKEIKKRIKKIMKWNWSFEGMDAYKDGVFVNLDSVLEELK